MAKLPTCPHCGQSVDPKQVVVKKHRGRTYHVTCYQQLMKEQYEVIEEKDPRKDLTEYISALFNLEVLTPLMQNQIEKYAKEYNLSYEDILLTLRYYYDILENDIRNTRGIGIIPYVYKEAFEFYKKREELIEKNKKINQKTIFTKRVVHVKVESKEDFIDIENL